jgi:hypothetical protein
MNQTRPTLLSMMSVRKITQDPAKGAQGPTSLKYTVLMATMETAIMEM